ncbi:MAG: MOSC domain-containing protein [Chthoniobacterales bacterium]
MKIEHLYISSAHNFFGHHGKEAGTQPMLARDRLECVAGKGICDDRFFDHKENYKGQITFFAVETYEMLCKELEIHDKGTEVFRRNVITRGVDLNALVGSHFTIQGVEFIGTEECRPCYWMDGAFGLGAEEKMKGHGGLRARILSDGILQVDGGKI